jgi:hypothetical protein
MKLMLDTVEAFHHARPGRYTGACRDTLPVVPELVSAVNELA